MKLYNLKPFMLRWAALAVMLIVAGGILGFAATEASRPFSSGAAISLKIALCGCLALFVLAKLGKWFPNRHLPGGKIVGTAAVLTAALGAGGAFLSVIAGSVLVLVA